jgi:hypothetical protein
MNTTVELLLESFDRLPDVEQRRLASEILRRTVNRDLPPLSDDDLVLSAEELFQELDLRESEA